MDESPLTTLTEQMLDRICSEYIEMPGLRLTCKQAQRLWGLHEDACCEALAWLVEAKFLCQTHGVYHRLTDGAVALPRLPMAHARVPHTLAPCA